jgi:hypothetical protein
LRWACCSRSPAARAAPAPGLDVIVQPKQIGPFRFGRSTEVRTGKRGEPAAFSITYLEPGDDPSVEEVRNRSRDSLLDGRLASAGYTTVWALHRNNGFKVHCGSCHKMTRHPQEGRRLRLRRASPGPACLVMTQQGGRQPARPIQPARFRRQPSAAIRPRPPRSNGAAAGTGIAGGMTSPSSLTSLTLFRIAPTLSPPAFEKASFDPPAPIVTKRSDTIQSAAVEIDLDWLKEPSDTVTAFVSPRPLPKSLKESL